MISRAVVLGAQIWLLTYATGCQPEPPKPGTPTSLQPRPSLPERGPSRGK